MRLAIQRGGATADLGDLPKGDAGIEATVAAMQAVVDDALADPETGPRLAKLAAELKLSGAKARAFADALYSFLVDAVVFVEDPRTVELLRHPGDLLDGIDGAGAGEGDCDDRAMLGAALIAAAGFRPVFITSGKRGPFTRSGKFAHVFFGIRVGAGALTPAAVIPMDPQEKTPAGAWPAVRRIRLWSLTPG